MTAKPYTFDVITPRGWVDTPMTVVAENRTAATQLAVQLVQTERGHTVVDVMDDLIVIADE